MIPIALDIVEEIRVIDFLSSMGSKESLLRPRVMLASSFGEAIELFGSDLWFDQKVHAQGELTVHLHNNHKDEYAGVWNRLVTDIRKRVTEAISSRLSEAVDHIAGGNQMVDAILLDLCLAVIETSYWRKFHRVPVFFGHLYEVYRVGRLPCGWTGDLEDWPKGTLVIY